MWRQCKSTATVSSSGHAELYEENERLRLEVERLQQLSRDSSMEAPDLEMSKFAGARSVFTTDPRFWYPHVHSPPPAMPCFRVMDDLGCIIPGAEEHAPELNREQALAIMVTMVRVSEFDKIYLDAQRQGRISFYMTSRGEEVRRHAPLSSFGTME